MNKVTLISMLSFVFLSGCSTWQEGFDCPVGEGMRCSSLSMVNKKMDLGAIDPIADEALPKTHFGDEMLKTLEDRPWI